MATTADPVVAKRSRRTAGSHFQRPPPKKPPGTSTGTGGAAGDRPPLSPIRRTIREIGFDLITAGIVVLLFVGYQLWGTGLAEASSQAQLKKEFSHLPAAPSGDAATVGPQIPQPAAPSGASVAHLVIPKIGLDKYVVEGVEDGDLRKGPGHYPNTPLPGQPGNSAIAGHRTTYGAPFYSLNDLQSDDDIYVTTAAGKFHYKVKQSEIVKPTEVGVVAPTTDNRLTLTTCDPRFQATNRLIVVGMLTDAPVAPPPTLAPPPADPKLTPVRANLGSGDAKAWPPALLYGLVAITLWVGFRLWAMRRRSWRWVPVLIGIPICFAPMWFFFENVIRLAPSNI